MNPEKFLQSYKCNCFQPLNYCNCSQKIISSDTLIKNVTDIAESLAEVMNLCGINIEKAKSSIEIIIYYFLHFGEIVHRIDAIPRKRLYKENLIHDLSRKCNMDRVEAQITYSIIKRAFKAFYHGTDLGGMHNNLLNNKSAHTSECLWVHAAQRTAQVYACYESMFYVCQKDLECKIKLIYNQLYGRICNRTQFDEEQECTCTTCLKRIAKESLKPVKVTTGMHDLNDPYEVIFAKEREELLTKQITKEESDMQSIAEIVGKKKIRCSCPSLNLTTKDYAYREVAESSNTGFSQGPFDCRWFSISKEEFDSDEAITDIKLPKEFSFPSYPKDEEHDLVCECTYDNCICKSVVDIFPYGNKASKEDIHNMLEKEMEE